MAVSLPLYYYPSCKISYLPHYRSGNATTSSPETIELPDIADNKPVHIGYGVGGTIAMEANDDGTRGVGHTKGDPFLKIFQQLGLPSIQSLEEPLLPKPIDSSCQDARSLYLMTLNIFKAYKKYLDTLAPETEMVDPFKLMFPHGTDTLAQVTGMLHYMILQLGLNMTVVPVGAIKPSNDDMPDGPNNVKAAYQFLKTKAPVGAYAIRSEAGDKTAIVLQGDNILKQATQGDEWLQPIRPQADGWVDLESGKVTFNKAHYNTLQADIPLTVKEQQAKIAAAIEKLTVVGEVLILKPQEGTDILTKFKETVKRLLSRKMPSAVLVEQTTPLQSEERAIFTLPVSEGKMLAPTTAWSKLMALLMLKTPREEIAQKLQTFALWEGVNTADAPPLLEPLPSGLGETVAYLKTSPTISAETILEVADSLNAKKPSNQSTQYHLILEGVGNGHLPIGYDSFMERFEAHLPPNSTLKARVLDKHKETPITSIAELEQVLSQLMEENSKAFLQQCFAKSHPILGAIDAVINQGITVWIGTGVPEGQANTLYSIGEMLNYMGVKTMENALPKGVNAFLSSLK